MSSVALGYIYGYAYGIKSMPPCRYYLIPHKKFRLYNLTCIYLDVTNPGLTFISQQKTYVLTFKKITRDSFNI